MLADVVSPTAAPTDAQMTANRMSLFMMANRFLGVDKFDDMLAKRSGQVLVAQVRTPGAGWP